MRGVGRLLVALAISTGVVTGGGEAGGHSGGLDANGGHHCREAGYASGACGPLDSYHTHSGSDSSGGGAGATASYRPAPLANSGRAMRARAMLHRLDRRREVRAGSYSRTAFRHWVDANDDGCDTRQAVLISESRVRAARTAACTVTRGAWMSAYDGRRWIDPSDLDVDHVVALKEAWRSGAHAWSPRERRRFANDLRFRPALRAVTDNVNQSKGDRDPAEWLPPRARCRYAITWVQVKHRWRLRIDRAEERALAAVLDGDCGARVIKVPRRAR